MNSPASNASSPALDFQTALGRLLTDGPLRDRFRANPLGALHVEPADQAALLALDPDDLEFQARILLRKRFVALTPLLPATLASLGEKAWPLFIEAARPQSPISATADALLFCAHLSQTRPKDLNRREWRRLEFSAASVRLRLHILWSSAALQILWRHGQGVREWLLRLG